MSSKCPACGGQEFKKNGFYKALGNRVQKFFCLFCDKDFTEKSGEKTFREHRPELNEEVKSLYLRGFGAKSISDMLGCSKRTVQMKIRKYLK